MVFLLRISKVLVIDVNELVRDASLYPFHSNKKNQVIATIEEKMLPRQFLVTLSALL
jgi:hypothetical protein